MTCERCNWTLCSECEGSATNCSICKDKFMDFPDCDTWILLRYSFISMPSLKCGTCSGTANNCTVTCDTQCSTYDPSGICTNCELGKMLDQNNQCISCHPKCLSCKDDQNTCECSKGKNRILYLNENCKCQDGYYDNGNINCKRCKVQNCKKCDNQGLCLECQNSLLYPENYTKAKNKQFLTQRFTFFEAISSNNIQQLQVCDLKCLECQGTSNNCTKCRIGQNRNNDQQCNCFSGYYDLKGTKLDCEKCHYSCLECSDYQTCTQCNLGEFRILDEFKNKCICKEGYKENIRTQKCQKCYQFSVNA